jgi:uncharacterized protein
MALYRIGVLSDTHGLLRPEAVQALQGVEHILHAGDVGGADILTHLRQIAPLTVVRGNIDWDEWADGMHETEIFEAGGASIYMIHNLYDMNISPGAAGFQAVVYGHSHRPSIKWEDSVLMLNPGSAGPRRFDLPVTLALLTIRDGELEPQLVELVQG